MALHALRHTPCTKKLLYFQCLTWLKWAINNHQQFTMVPAEAVPPSHSDNGMCGSSRFLVSWANAAVKARHELWRHTSKASILTAFLLLCFAFDTLGSLSSQLKWPGLHRLDFSQFLFFQLTQFVFYRMCWGLLYAKRPQWGRYAQRALAKPSGLTVYLVFLLPPVALASARFQAESSEYSECCSCCFWIGLADSRELSLHTPKDFQSSQDYYFEILNK